MSDKSLTDEILSMPVTAPRCQIKEKHYTTLHKREVTKEEFYIVARFIFALTHVIVPLYKMPLLLDIGITDLRLPVWRKTGDGWKLADYQVFSKEAFGLPVPMMRAISRKLSIGENLILDALHSLSMISVDMLTSATEGPRRYRQTFGGKFVNPSDCQPLSVKPIQNVEGFVLDKQRVQERIKKDLQKRGTLSN